MINLYLITMRKIAFLFQK